MPGAQAEQEGVGVPAAAVHLDGEVVAAGPLPVPERGRRVGVLDPVPDPRADRQHRDLGEGRGPTGQQRRVPGCAEQGELRVRVGRGQRLRRGQREHEVAEPAAAQHRDPAHVREPGRQRADDRAAGPRGRAGAHETSGVQDPPASRAAVSSTSAGSRSARAGTRTDAVAAAPALT